MELSEKTKSLFLIEKMKKCHKKQAKLCNERCRYAVYAIIAAIWGLIEKKDDANHDSNHMLAILLIAAVFYLVIDACTYYYVACKSKWIHTKLKKSEIQTDEAETGLMTMYKITFWKLSIQIPYCILLVVFLGYYVLKTY